MRGGKALQLIVDDWLQAVNYKHQPTNGLHLMICKA